MKDTLAFDPDDYDYGPATQAIRTVIREWAGIDWFVPSSATDEELTRLFEEHNAIAHRFAPDAFPKRVTTRCVSGGWTEFSAWCKRVREQIDWDWRWSVLKKLSRDHSTVCGWSPEAHAAQVPTGHQRPGDLFFVYNAPDGKTSVIWNNIFPQGSAIQATSHDLSRESSRFYFSHAQIDAFSCIQWLLAEKHNDLTGNPFIPLVRCYRAGAYPFSLNQDTVVLFRFTGDERLVPRATLLPTRG